ncbi:glycoside hydrolase family 3 N-terminal domain-containing protein [Leifsonia sp. 2MCAF36]|uniref:glycoside hydrolase family 3 N-terminal domain-containing protein n=1 Tax=Leifsonia sp. 2MCAF36 TaxID=3232988 RepID=UPI003F987E74
MSYRDHTLPIAHRVEDLLSRLSIEEKAGQLTQYFYTGTDEPLPDDFDIESLPPEYREHIDLPRRIEEAVKDGRAGSLLFVRDGRLINRLQRLAVEETAHGIPLLFGFDVVHGWRTVFPVPIALAATWDPAQIEQVQAAAAREARSVGVHWTFAPTIDIAHDPRWGRMIEGSGEDPHLGATIAAAHVRGFQGDLGPDSVMATPKHFLGYGAARGGRDYEDVDISESELRNVYLPPFRAAVEAGAAAVMSAYMDLNGVPASGNRRLLTELLREELGFDGFVVSDANAVRSLETQHFAKDLEDAAVRALAAGLDMEMCMMGPAFDLLPQAVAEGRVSEDLLDAAVRRVLTAKFRLGLFERPYSDEAATATTLASPDHRALAQTAAERSLVLLKNEAGTLPLQLDTIRSVAVIGQLADSRRDTLGPWIFDHDTEETVTILEGVRNRFAGAAEIVFEPGAGIPERLHPSPFDVLDPTVERTPADWDDESAIRRAVTAAESADVAIVVVGQRQNQIGEKASVSTLDLPARQLEQLQQIHATGTPIVLVVMSGRPLDLRWPDENVAAIVQAWYPGTRGGEAVAAVLTGDVNPAGRLPFTWPQHVGQVPLVYNHYRTFLPHERDSRYFNESNAPLYPFGHGLSYASFRYENLRVDRPELSIGETALVSVDVVNESDRDGDEVVQLYIHQRYGTSSRPVRELKAFTRVAVPAGGSRTVDLELGPRQLRYWSAATNSEVQDATLLDIWVGGSSRADLGTTLTVL